MSDDALFGITSSCILNSSACVSCFSYVKNFDWKTLLWHFQSKKRLSGHLCALKAHSQKVTLSFSHGSSTFFSCLMHMALMTFPYCRILTHSSVNSILFHERSLVNRHLLAVLHLRLNEGRSSLFITGNGLFLLILGPSVPAAFFLYCSPALLFLLFMFLYIFPYTCVCQWL